MRLTTGTDDLLIIGNGFDLQCQMPTKYDDFMKWMRDNFRTSVWTPIFESAKNHAIMGGNWYDIEGVIEKMILDFEPLILATMVRSSLYAAKSSPFPERYFPSKERTFLNECFLENTLSEDLLDTTYLPVFEELIDEKFFDFAKDVSDIMEDYFRSEFRNVTCQFISEIQHVIEESTERKHIGFFLEHFFSKGNRKFENFLLLELERFEGYFTTYIHNLDIDGISYFEKSNALLNALIAPHSNDNPYKTLSIMSFNYTELPIDEFGGELSRYYKISNVNVHGTIRQDNIIFGVDTTKLFTSSKKDDDVSKIKSERILPFTKTYRKMMLPDPKNWQLPKDPGYIIFYGHSLSEADYSYFQSIFDYVDLYESDVHLEFVYSSYEHNQKIHERRKHEMKRVHKLINTYGMSLMNKEKGKNLLHKLLLENRIKLSEL